MTDNNENNLASAIPKRTIKLKPANPGIGSAAATLKLKTPAAPASAPVSADPAPAPADPAPAPAAKVSTDTAKLARRTIKLVPQSGSPLAGPATAPATPVTPAINKVSAAPAAAVPTDTAKLAKRTIKLTPASGAPSAPAAPTPAAAQAPSAPTIKLASPGNQPVSTDTAKLSKRTIKLTPASGAGTPAAGAAPSAPTIKLGSPAAPSAPTIKLTTPSAQASEDEVPTDTAKISRQTNTNAGSTPGMGAETVKLRPQSQQTIRLTPSAGGLQLKKPVAKTGLAAAEAPQELTNKLAGVKPAEDSTTTILCLVSSIVALLLLGFTCFMMYAQYSNFFDNADINVPGVERLTGSANNN